MNDQRSVTDQLHDLISIANSHGLYDAADWLSAFLESRRSQLTWRCETCGESGPAKPGKLIWHRCRIEDNELPQVTGSGNSSTQEEAEFHLMEHGTYPKQVPSWCRACGREYPRCNCPGGPFPPGDSALDRAPNHSFMKQPSENGFWVHMKDATICDVFISSRTKPRNSERWWCTEHQSHLEWREREEPKFCVHDDYRRGYCGYCIDGSCNGPFV